MGKYYINNNIRIENNAISKNGEEIFSSEKDNSFAEFSKAAYKNCGISYSKFYKMDSLSKLGFLAAEYLLPDLDRKNILPEQIAVILVNKSSSLHTDKNYQNLLQSDIPSPAVFVYTLPNIVIGEICIRHDIKGETMFLIHDDFEPEFVFDLVNCQLESSDIKWCITGWLEVDMNGLYNAKLYLLSQEESTLEFAIKNLK